MTFVVSCSLTIKLIPAVIAVPKCLQTEEKNVKETAPVLSMPACVCAHPCGCFETGRRLEWFAFLFEASGDLRTHLILCISEIMNFI